VGVGVVVVGVVVLGVVVGAGVVVAGAVVVVVAVWLATFAARLAFAAWRCAWAGCAATAPGAPPFGNDAAP
jgi:hypothetical protein